MPEATTVRIQLNGEHRSLEKHTTLETLINQLDLNSQRVAVELNRNILKRSEFPTTKLAEGDRVELVHFVGGG